MVVRSTSGDSRTVLPALIVFFLCCMVFSGALFAIPTEETLAADEADAEVPVAEQVEESPAEETVIDKAALRLAEKLKANEKCLRCHKREKT